MTMLRGVFCGAMFGAGASFISLVALGLLNQAGIIRPESIRIVWLGVGALFGVLVAGAQPRYAIPRVKGEIRASMIAAMAAHGACYLFAVHSLKLPFMG